MRSDGVWAWARITCVVACLVVAPVALARAQPPGRPPTTWILLAQSLVRQERAVGVVLKERDLSRTADRRDRPGGGSIAEVTRGSVTGFISAETQMCRAALGKPVVPLQLSGRPLTMLFDLVMQDAEASRTQPPGVLGGGLSPSERSQARWGQSLRMSIGPDDTLESALDRLVSVGLPLGWGVVQRDDSDSSPCQIILFTEDTVMWTSWDALYPPPPLPIVKR